MVSGHLLPSVAATYNLGSASYPWADIFAASLKPRGIDNSSLKFYAWDNDTNTMIEVAKLLSASEPILGISRAGDIYPATDAFWCLGAGTKRWSTIDCMMSNVYTELVIGSSTVDGQITFGDIMESDYFKYDSANERWVFYIGGAAVGYIDAAGFHNGAP